jgi:RNA polymerase sigma factor (sigma-70 family)
MRCEFQKIFLKKKRAGLIMGTVRREGLCPRGVRQMVQGELGTLIHHLRKLAGASKLDELTDGELLQLFINRHDEAAFAALLERQGPMVFGLCKRLLHRQQDAEDAFQAVFLVLVRRAASISRRESVAGWLYRVAYRVAMKAKLSAARRAARENRAAQSGEAVEPEPEAEVSWREVRPVLDEELNQLPEKYRAPLVLCYLQGKTYTEAARELGWNPGTLSGRMAHGRDLLRKRLVRRGITMTASLLTGALSAPVASAAVPPLLMKATCRGLLELAAGKAAAGLFSSSVVRLAEAGVRALVLTKLKVIGLLVLATALLTLGTVWAVWAALPEQPARQRPFRPRLAQGPRPIAPLPNQRPTTDVSGDPLPPQALARAGTVRWRHGDAVLAVAVSPRGNTIASVGMDSILRLWDATGKEKHRVPYTNQRARVWALAFSRDAKVLAVAGSGPEIHLVDPATGKERGRISHRYPMIASVAFAPDGQTLATVHWDRKVRFWNAETGDEAPPLIEEQSNVCSIAFAPRGQTLATGRRDGAILLWDLRTGHKRQEFQGHWWPVKALAFSPDGKRLASADCDRTFSPVFDFQPIRGGKVPASPGGDRTVRVWKVGEVEELHLFRNVPAGILQSLGFSPAGKWLAFAAGAEYGTGQVKVWNTATGQEHRAFAKRPCRAYAAAFASDDTLICAGGEGNTVRLWDLTQGKETLSGRGHQGRVDAVAFAPDGKTLATGSSDRTVRLWDPATGKELRRLAHAEAVQAVVFSPRGRVLASAGQGGQVHLWNPATGRELRRLAKQPGAIYSLAFSPDGTLLASAGGLVFSPEGKPLVSPGDILHLWRVADGKELFRFAAQQSPAFGVAFSPDGKTLASGHYDWKVRLWDVHTGRLLRTLTGAQGIVPQVEFSPDGKCLAGCCFDRAQTPLDREEASIRLWDVRTGEVICRIIVPKLHFRNYNFCCIAFSPDGKTLAMGSWDRSICFYDPATGRLRRRIAEAHQGDVLSLAFSPDGKRLASGSADTSVLVWDVNANAVRKDDRNETVKRVK